MTAVLGLMCAATSGTAKAETRYLAVGTSETVGLGLPGPRSSYPFLVAQRCRLQSSVIGSIGSSDVPAWPLGAAPALFTFFVSPNYFIFGNAALNERRLGDFVTRARRSHVPGVLILPPMTSGVPALAQLPRGIALAEKRFRARVLFLRDSKTLHVLDLSRASIGAGDLQADGLHPTRSGQQKISNLLTSVITEMGLCGR